MKNLYVCFIVVMLFLSGCDYPSQQNEWKKIDDFLSYKQWDFEINGAKETIEIYRVVPGGYKIKLVYSSEAPKYVSDWLYYNDGAEIVVNGPYFSEDYSPSGYVKINNTRVGNLIFNQELSGLVQIEDDKLFIRDLGVQALKADEDVEFGLQSYPFLLKNSAPALTEDSGKIARRTAIGTDADDNVYLIVSDTTHLSLFDLMNQLINTGIPFNQVLNLDGGTSTGIAVSEGNYHEIKDSLVKVPGVIVFDKI
ncbi:phosphodiester glycosidase family protein [Candidatus Peregrinibacteria bacterium]|nr:phosphodiester glycosidase family protein [Candidatus Peregrinibacteria bacterium]